MRLNQENIPRLKIKTFKGIFHVLYPGRVDLFYADVNDNEISQAIVHKMTSKL
jgi:hypothetical protein